MDELEVLNEKFINVEVGGHFGVFRFREIFVFELLLKNICLLVLLNVFEFDVDVAETLLVALLINLF